MVRVSKLQFLAALILAAVYELWQRAKGIREALKTSPEVSKELAGERMAVCKTCYVFFSPLKTCGSPLSRLPELGCHCYMPAAVGTKHNCWLYDRNKSDEAGGWPEPMNSFPYE